MFNQGVTVIRVFYTQLTEQGLDNIIIGYSGPIGSGWRMAYPESLILSPGARQQSPRSGTTTPARWTTMLPPSLDDDAPYSSTAHVSQLRRFGPSPEQTSDAAPPLLTLDESPPDGASLTQSGNEPLDLVVQSEDVGSEVVGVGSGLLTHDSSIADDNPADETLNFDTVASPGPHAGSREQTFISARLILEIRSRPRARMSLSWIRHRSPSS